MPRLEALYRSWKRNPPVHKLVAAFVEYEPPLAAGEASAGVTHMTSEAVDAIIKTGGVLISGDMLQGLPHGR